MASVQSRTSDVETSNPVRVCTVEELRQRGRWVVSGGRHGIVVFWHEDRAFAVDNRCPHMGFPLARGSVRDGVLTCHWHHARFDLASGGTFDPFADDVQVYPTSVHDGAIWVELHPAGRDRRTHWEARLEDGLEQNLALVIIKAVLALLDSGVAPREILAIGGRFGARYREAGWGPGLTILTALGNVLDDLAPADQALALYHGLVHVAADCAGVPPRFILEPLPGAALSPDRLKAWCRQFVEVRDSDAAERVLLTAIAAGVPPAGVGDILFAAATDHFFLAGGHTLDFINKACELLDLVGWEAAPLILSSTVRGLCQAQRAEEQNAWRYPTDLVELIDAAVTRLPDLVTDPAAGGPVVDREGLAACLLADDPAAAIGALQEALVGGASLTAVSGVLRYAAALRLARFHTSNEFGDWITVLHTFTYCNALHAALTRAPSRELARGIFHGAGKLYLDRFLNLPAARLPEERAGAFNAPGAAGHDAATYLDGLVHLCDREQQVNPAARAVHDYITTGGAPTPLLHTLGHLLLREDAEFHSYQALEAGFATYHALARDDQGAAARVLVGVARYLAAHAPTSRSMLQTARSALRLRAGEDLSIAPEEE